MKDFQRGEKLHTLLQRVKELLNPTDFALFREEADEINAHMTTRIIVGGILIALVDMILQMILGKRQYFGYCFYMLIVFVFIFGVTVLQYTRSYTHATVRMYVIVGILMAFSIILNMGVEPEDGCLFFITTLCVLPPLIFDRPWRMMVMTAGITAVYVLANCIFVDEPDNLLRNCLYSILVALISMTLCIGRTDTRLDALRKNRMASQNAMHDPLTMILNRRGGEETIRTLISSGVPGAFIIIDVDNFKRVNDTYGHKRGDEVLKSVTDEMRRIFRVEDILMRYGGDEFIVYAVRMVDWNTVSNRLRQLNTNVKSIVLDEEKNDVITVSVGCCINDSTYPSYDDCFAVSDHLLYKTKQNGKDSFRCVDYSYDEARVNRYKEENEAMDSGKAAAKNA